SVPSTDPLLSTRPSAEAERDPTTLPPAVQIGPADVDQRPIRPALPPRPEVGPPPPTEDGEVDSTVGQPRGEKREEEDRPPLQAEGDQVEGGWSKKKD